MNAFQRIGEYCKARGYHYRLKGLREYWVRARDGEAVDSLAQSLLEGWQLPPYETALEMREKANICPVCSEHSGPKAKPRTVMILEDRARFRCDLCGHEWLSPV